MVELCRFFLKPFISQAFIQNSFTHIACGSIVMFLYKTGYLYTTQRLLLHHKQSEQRNGYHLNKITLQKIFNQLLDLLVCKTIYFSFGVDGEKQYGSFGNFYERENPSTA